MREWLTDIAEMRQGLRPSACPGLFRIVPARDGGICRVKLPLGHLSSSAARAVADAAVRFGNGIVEVTNRANLQIRGVAAVHETRFIAALLEAGLGAPRPELDDLSNVMVSPTAGIDPQQKMDTLPLARALLVTIQANKWQRTLSPKFSILLDGGEGTAVVDHPHDIWLASTADEGRMAIGIAGSPPTRRDDETPFIVVGRDDAVNAAATAVILFLEEAARDPSANRLKHLLARLSREEFLDRLCKRGRYDLFRKAADGSGKFCRLIARDVSLDRSSAIMGEEALPSADRTIGRG